VCARPGQVFAQRASRARRCQIVLRILMLESPGDRRHLRLSRPRGHLGLQAPEPIGVIMVGPPSS